jgi:predicted RNA-binding Zn ribbon-like protein
MSEPQFQLLGGNPALDFVNTIHDWTVHEPRDYLTEIADALRFGAVAGLLSSSEARRLNALPARQELRRLRELRSRLERILRATVIHRAPLSADLEALARESVDAARAMRLRRAKHQLVREIDSATAGIALLRWRLVEAAIVLLTSSRLSDLKTCPSCGWFFLDTSKNRSRRWCSMAMCGSSAKARRYYWRTKARAANTRSQVQDPR